MGLRVTQAQAPELGWGEFGPGTHTVLAVECFAVSVAEENWNWKSMCDWHCHEAETYVAWGWNQGPTYTQDSHKAETHRTRDER